MLGTAGRIAGGFIGSILRRWTTDKDAIVQGQQRANEAEIQGAPASGLRLWRSFLGWVLALVFAWEIVGRAVVSTYWPQAVLPPSALEEVSHLLMGLLGLGL